MSASLPRKALDTGSPKRTSRAPTLISLLIFAAVVVVAILSRPASPPSLNAAGLADLESIGQLQAKFNEDAGRPRLILLLSPT